MSKAMAEVTQADREVKGTFPPGCGPACPRRDWVSGRCDRHGPTAQDQIVEEVTQAFRRDVRRIMGARNG